MKSFRVRSLCFSVPSASAWSACPADAAGKFDGSVPFLCVPTAVAECVAEGECRPGTAESENLPDFFKIDLKARTVRAEDQGQAVAHQADRPRATRRNRPLRFGVWTRLGPDGSGEDRQNVGGGHGRRRELRDLRYLPSAVGAQNRDQSECAAKP